MRAIKYWNHHLIEQCRVNLRKYEAAEPTAQNLAALERSSKIIDAIQVAVDSQMVLADIGLSIVLLNPAFDASCQASAIAFDPQTAYTQVDALDTASTYVYHHVSFELACSQLTDIVASQ